MNSSKEGINIHCPNCGFSFEIFDLELSAYNCPSCDYEIMMRTKGDTVKKAAPTQTFVGSIDEKPLIKPGSNLGGFELISEIGRGGMGVVYKALQKSLNREVALKILPEHLSSDPDFIKRFQREAQALATLTHPNIVSILDRCEADDVYFFVMEYVNGKSLRQIMRNRRLHLYQVLSIIADVCNGLAYAHSRGIIHRDIKPENILIDTNGIVKITDFGLSRILRKGSEFSRITNTAITMGTLDYMSPEQRISSKSADHRSDIYAVGVMMYELLTNEIPVGNFEHPSTLEPSLPPIIDEIVMKALKSNSVDRFQTVTQMKEQIDALIEDVKKLQNYENAPAQNYSIPVAKPVKNNQTYEGRTHQEKWKFHHDLKKKGFFRSILSYEFLIIGLILALFIVPVLIPILGFLLIVRIFVGDVFKDYDESKPGKKREKAINSNIQSEFVTDPVAAGINNPNMQNFARYKDKFKKQFKEEGAKGFFKDMKKQFKQKYKEIKKQIQSDLKQYVRNENTLTKDEIEAEIDKRVQFEVEKKLNIEIERIRQEEKARSYNFSILTVISMLLFIGASLGILVIGAYIFAQDFLLTWLFSLDLDSIQNLLEWKKYAGGALLFSMFLFSAITAGSCKKLRKFGRSMALLAMFFTLMSAFFWLYEWKEVKHDVQTFQEIKNDAQTNPKESAKKLKEIIYKPDDFNVSPNATRFMAMKCLFDTDIDEYKTIRLELKSAPDERIRNAWIKAAQISKTKIALSTVEPLLKDKSADVVKNALLFVMMKYPDKGWSTIKNHYDQLSYENKKWLIEQIGDRKPNEMLDWLRNIENSKLDDEIHKTLTEYRTLSSLPFFADQLFSENREYRNIAFSALKEFPKDNIYGIFIAYLKNGKDVEMQDRISDFLEDTTDFDGDENNVAEWSKWLTQRHKKIYAGIDEKLDSASNLLKELGGLSEVESQINKQNEVLTNPEVFYSILCKVLDAVYNAKLDMLDTLAPEKYENAEFKFENTISFSEFVTKLENLKKTIEFKYPEVPSNSEITKIKQKCEIKSIAIKRKLWESFSDN